MIEEVRERLTQAAGKIVILKKERKEFEDKYN
jgi:hypothetical protein